MQDTIPEENGADMPAIDHSSSLYKDLYEHHTKIFHIDVK